MSFEFDGLPENLKIYDSLTNSTSWKNSKNEKGQLSLDHAGSFADP